MQRRPRGRASAPNKIGHRALEWSTDPILAKPGEEGTAQGTHEPNSEADSSEAMRNQMERAGQRHFQRNRHVAFGGDSAGCRIGANKCRSGRRGVVEWFSTGTREYI